MLSHRLGCDGDHAQASFVQGFHSGIEGFSLRLRRKTLRAGFPVPLRRRSRGGLACSMGDGRRIISAVLGSVFLGRLAARHTTGSPILADALWLPRVNRAV